jgi:arylsulfatase A-like enzyme
MGGGASGVSGQDEASAERVSAEGSARALTALAGLTTGAAALAACRVARTLHDQQYLSLDLKALSALTVGREVAAAVIDTGLAAGALATFGLAAAVLAKTPIASIALLGRWALAPLSFLFRQVSRLPRVLLAAATIFSVVSLGGSYAFTRWAWGSSPPLGPNVLLVVMDTVRSANLSLYGYERETTPHLDAFAREALVFENAFAIAPWTIPNHASMFTGRYACDHGATQESKFLAPSALTIAEILTNHGYDTAGITSNANVAAKKGFSQGFLEYVDLWRSSVREPFEAGRAVPEGDSGAFATAIAAEEWLAEKRDTDRPWFLFLNYIEAHSPYEPAERFWRAYLPDGLPASEHVTEYDYVDYLAGAYQMSAEDFRAAEALYDAEIRYLDEQIGALLKRLDERGDLSNTLVIITSDHGEYFGEHGLIGHQFGLYDPVLRVPLIVRPPKGTAVPGRASARVEVIDLFATILDAAGAPASVESASRSVLGESQRGMALAESYRPLKYLRKLEARHPNFDASRFDRRIRSIRDGDYKFIWSSDGRHELYQIETDSLESRDLAAHDAEQVARFSRILEGWSQNCDSQVALAADAEPELDDEMRAELRALGYVE